MKAEGSPVPDFFSLGPSAIPTPGLIPNEKEGYEQTIHEVGAPLSPFHYQLRKVCRVDERFIVADEQSWRVPYLEEKIHEQFRTHIYGWVGLLSISERTNKADRKTWEDPDVDVKKLGINSEDKLLAITSAGDNVLHYALAAQCKQIHAVGECVQLHDFQVADTRYEPVPRPYPRTEACCYSSFGLLGFLALVR
jgi:betaine lipid synthase